MINWFYVIILGVIVGVFSAMLDWPFSVSISIILLFALCSIGFMYYIAFASTNLLKIKNYIENHKKDPMLNYLLVLENGTKEDEIEAMDRIIEHYKQPVMKLTYEMNRAIRLNDFERAEQFADKLMDTPNGPYGKASIAALTGNRDRAKSYPLKKAWMIYAVDAQLALAENKMETFDQSAEKAVEGAKGLQRYSLYYSLIKARQEHEWKN
ncbi:hypothetical protein B857_00441 [Solibacillus isronensis B3W22]|uniref:Uncharacterized protein n=1 Tax=Solibacillus isronensis B3W22 TaxID=1224748 RepID=K1L2D5_9BACL|nr:hypothetical protein [Solibacillus isronensis]AMO85590.1 hypothetical protein SOLI23_08335 [Solibacillus silvestris]EKB46232.1 hypothetical protein B857_00441 [Solibacillus isronensis B3W22]